MKTLLLAAAMAFTPARSRPSDAAGPSAPVQQPAPTTQVPLPDADPALWVVRDDDTTIYLFGTFHMLDGRPWFDDEIRRPSTPRARWCSRRASRRMVGMQSLILQYAVDPQGRRLSARLNAEQNAELGRVLQTIGASANAFDRLEPWYVAISMPVIAAQQLGISGENGPEGVITRAARARSIADLGARGNGVAAASVRRHARRAAARLSSPVARRVRDDPGSAAADARRLVDWRCRRACGSSLEQSRRKDPAGCGFCSPTATGPGPAGSRSGWRSPGTVFLAVGAAHLDRQRQRPGSAASAGPSRRAGSARRGAGVLIFKARGPGQFGAPASILRRALFPYGPRFPSWSSLEA